MDLNLLKQKPFYLDDEQLSWVKSTLENMSEDEKIGQLFCACVRQGTIEELESLNDITPFGGVMYRPLPADICVKLTNYLNQLKVQMKMEFMKNLSVYQKNRLAQYHHRCGKNFENTLLRYYECQRK